MELSWEEVYYENFICGDWNVLYDYSCQYQKEFRNGLQTNDGHYAFLADWWLMKSNSQTGAVIWEHNFYSLESSEDYGESSETWIANEQNVEALAFDQTSNSDFVILVKVQIWNNNDGDYDGGFYVLRTNSQGVLQETIPLQILDNQASYLNVTEIGTLKQTNDGGYIISGYTNLADNQNSNNGNTAFLHKLNSDFTTQWHNQFNKPGYTYTSMFNNTWSVIETSDGDFLMTGSYTSSIADANGQTMSLSRHSSVNGDEEWVKDYPHPLNSVSNNNGNTRHDRLVSIKEGIDGHYFIAGLVHGSYMINTCDICDDILDIDCQQGLFGGQWFCYDDEIAPRDYHATWIAKIDVDNEGLIVGEVILSPSDLPTEYKRDQIVHSLDITSDGGCIIGGYQEDQLFILESGGTSEYLSRIGLMVKLDSDLNLEWEETFHCEECGILPNCDDNGDDIVLLETYNEDGTYNETQCIDITEIKFISENNQGEYIFAGSNMITNQTDAWGDEFYFGPQPTIWAGKMGLSGCIDQLACNYCNDCSIDDETCEYPPTNFDCDGNCIVLIDCLGICAGDAVEDNCGVCDNNPENDCTQDCLGVWGGDAVEDNCGVCDNNPENDCIQDCLGVLGGDAVEDNCGVCDNNPENDCTQDCLGVWGGDAVEDNCGVCDNNPENDCTQDCLGVWGGDAVEDNCGVCDNNPENDCLEGCTNVLACNYCSDCILDDGSCEFETCVGCTDTDAANYCSTCTLGDIDLCIYIGCTDEEACNYCPECDLSDDTSCTYPEQYYDCNGDCLNDLDLDGICNALDNCPGDYNPNQEDFDGDDIGDACDGIGIEDNIINKSIIAIVDILGREIAINNRYGIYIYIYDDGSVEKKYILE